MVVTLDERGKDTFVLVDESALGVDMSTFVKSFDVRRIWQ